MISKIPPNNIETEKKILGRIMSDRDALIYVISKINDDVFYNANHQFIYSTIKELELNNIAPDIVILAEYLNRIGKLEKCGGAVYLSELLNYSTIGDVYKSHCDILLEHYTKRELIKYARKIEENSFNPMVEVEDILNEVSSFDIRNKKETTMTEPKQLARLIEDTIIGYQKGIISGIKTPNKKINTLMQGGFQDGELTIIAGRPSSGKTSYIIDCINYTGFKIPIGFYSLEQSKKAIALRLAINNIGIDIYRIKRLAQPYITDNEMRKILDYCSKVFDSDIYIDDKSNWDIENLILDVKNNIKKYKWKIVFIDYLQLIGSRQRDKKADEISEVSMGLKRIAKDNNIPIIATAQLNRGVEARKDSRPVLSDLKESGQIEQDADVVIMPYNAWKNNVEFFKGKVPSRDKIELIINKNREGATGSEIVNYYENLFRFRSIDYYENSPIPQQTIVKDTEFFDDKEESIL